MAEPVERPSQGLGTYALYWAWWAAAAAIGLATSLLGFVQPYGERPWLLVPATVVLAIVAIALGRVRVKPWTWF